MRQAPVTRAGRTRTLETLTVNRPHGAFGFLLGLLALAMFAVSSTSRSTAVRLLPPMNRHAQAVSKTSWGAKLLPVVATATMEAAERGCGGSGIDDGLCDAASIDSIGSGTAVEGTAGMLRSDAQVVAPHFVVRGQFGHRPLEADLPLFEHVGWTSI